jgi:spectinomycin phosphotransferase
VYARPADFTDAELAGDLRRHWRLAGPDLRYAPVGYGGFHWLVTDAAGARWFATASRLTGDGQFAELLATMAGAVRLAEAGLDFVVAPVPARTGEPVIRVRPDYAVSLFPFADGTPGHFGDPLTSADRAAVTSMLAALHTATPAAGPVPVRALTPPSRADLEISLRERGRPWRGGPYAEAARALVSEHAAGLEAALGVFDDLIAHVTAAGGQPVLTHGEPHPGNLIRRGADRVLIDWDTVGLALPERDLWWILPGDSRGSGDSGDSGGSGGSGDLGAEANLYAALTGRDVSPAALALYRLRWDLDDIGLLLADFRRPHEQDQDTEVGWAGLVAATERLGTADPAAAW